MKATKVLLIILIAVSVWYIGNIFIRKYKHVENGESSVIHKELMRASNLMEQAAKQNVKKIQLENQVADLEDDITEKLTEAQELLDGMYGTYYDEVNSKLEGMKSSFMQVGASDQEAKVDGDFGINLQEGSDLFDIE